MAKAKITKKAPATKDPAAKKKPAAPVGQVDKPVKPELQIAALDRELLRLMQERAKLVLRAAKGDAAQASAPAAGGLDEQAAAALVAQSRGPLSPQSLRAVLREVSSGCRGLIRERRIAFLGPLYSYSHLAAIHRFGQSVEFVPVGSIPAVFEEVNRGHSDFGLVPVENSTDGRIADTLDMFTRLPVRICGEVEMVIHHNLHDVVIIAGGLLDLLKFVYVRLNGQH